MGIRKYCREFPDDYSETTAELYCFATWAGPDTGALGRYRHLKNVITTLWTDRDWTPWDDMRARAFCDRDNWVQSGNQLFHCQGNVGCAASGKTDFWATAAVAWWMADPTNSAVAITSIHKKMIRQRSWAAIQKCYHGLEDQRFGNFVDSQLEWQIKKGDSKHAIHALAVGAGETQKAMQVLAGLHCKRIMVIVDEAPGTPEAIFHVVKNLRKGASEFVLIAAGNAISRMDAHGRICEPKDGWSKIDEDTEIWETKGVPEWDIEPGICIHFHGKRSPNVKAGKTIYPYLYTYENYLGTKGKEDTLLYWTYDAGFWPPEGISNTVFDEATVEKHGGMEKVIWDGGVTEVAALDPAFGGDECVLRVGRIGFATGGPRLLEVGKRYSLKLRQKSETPVDYQIARQVIDLCRKNNVLPGNFALDCTGTGRGVAAILEAEWSPSIVKVEFGGSPSTQPASLNDPRLCKEVYDRKVTELWWGARELLVGGQLKGLDRETVVQFCKRLYDLKTKKIRLETKEECKERLGRSPDDADCVAVLCELARQRGVAATGIPRTKSLYQSRMQAVKDLDEIYQTEEVTDNKEPSFMAWMDDT